ncbi:MAG: hypothetical protein ACOYJ1_13815 [Peptococcales bacterium]|jgi:hypothetical protein
MIANDIKLQFTEDGLAQVVLSTKHRQIDISKHKEVVAKGKELTVEIKQYRHRRSLDANAYCWVMCQKLAEVLRCTKEEVYQKAIKEVGQFEILAIKEEAAEQFIKVWCDRGLGWFAQEMPGCKIDGCKRIIAYYGSSCYDTKSMSILIDYIVQECKEQGIDTMSGDNLKALIEEWGRD